MRTLFGAALMLFVLSSHAITSDQLEQYVSNDAKAIADRDSGILKMSEYYLISYMQVERANDPRKGVHMERYAKLMGLAIDMEEGRISKAKFESERMLVNARSEQDTRNYVKALNDEEERKRRAQMKAIADAMASHPIQPTQLPPLRTNKTLTCTTTSLSPGMATTTCN